MSPFENAAGSAPLSAALERALVVQLGHTWSELNQNHFRGRLRRPVIALSDTERRLGAWNGGTRTLSLARVLVLDRSWMVVREVLKHEMAHQFVDEVLGVRDQTAHGPAFDNVCRQHGFDASAVGLPELAEGAAGLGGGSPILRRIARLLALADSPNAHEAEAAMRAAQRLMLTHNIDVAAAATREGFTFRQVGTPSGRVSGAEHVLAGILARHFFVEAIWVPSYLPLAGKQGRVLELCGTVSNLDVAGYVHGFLLETGERLWRQHRESRGLDGNRERRRFLLGVMMGFDDKLAAASAENRREGLIWVGDPALTDYLGRRYPRRTGGAGIGVRATESYEDGRRAGREIVLTKPMPAPGAPPTQRGRFLPSRS
ncbi:MAG TPA: DUF2786 domain-containing protein [Polyangia bacterium]